jgi:hypothetical protein
MFKVVVLGAGVLTCTAVVAYVAYRRGRRDEAEAAHELIQTLESEVERKASLIYALCQRAQELEIAAFRGRSFRSVPPPKAN